MKKKAVKNQSGTPERVVDAEVATTMDRRVMLPEVAVKDSVTLDKVGWPTMVQIAPSRQILVLLG